MSDSGLKTEREKKEIRRLSYSHTHYAFHKSTFLLFSSYKSVHPSGTLSAFINTGNVHAFALTSWPINEQ